MPRIVIACFLFFVISAAPTVAMNSFFNWHVQTGFSLFSVKNTDFQAKIQPAETFQTGFLFSIGDHFGIETAIGLFYVHPSDALGGYRYRAMDILLTRVSLQGRLNLSSDGEPTGPWIGLSAGGEFNYAHYTLTKIYFFYPSIYAAPFIDLYAADLYASENPRWNIRVLLPVHINFRIDMEASVASGVGVAFLYRP